MVQAQRRPQLIKIKLEINFMLGANHEEVEMNGTKKRILLILLL